VTRPVVPSELEAYIPFPEALAVSGIRPSTFRRLLREQGALQRQGRDWLVDTRVLKQYWPEVYRLALVRRIDAAVAAAREATRGAALEALQRIGGSGRRTAE
jgi:hypothetical protein